MPIALRVEQPPDIAGIDAVHREAFESFAESRLVRLLRDRGELLVSLVAVDGPTIVGHVAASPVTIAAKSCSAIGIGPIAVREASRRQGIGASLMRAVVAEATARGLRLAVLLGSPSYYSRFGFEPAGPVGLENEYGAGDAFMVLELAKGASVGVQGLVRYASAFGECDA